MARILRQASSLLTISTLPDVRERCQIYWAYNTGGTVSTSVVLSGDGTQIAFIHTPASGASSLVILKWKAGEGSTYNPPTISAATPGTATSTAATYVACKSG